MVLFGNKFEDHTMDFLIYGTFSLSIFTVILLLSVRKKNNIAVIFAIILLSALNTPLLIRSLYILFPGNRIITFFIFIKSFPYLYGSLLYFYLISVTDKAKKINLQLHLLPFIISTFLLIIYVSFFIPTEIKNNIHNIMTSHNLTGEVKFEKFDKLTDTLFAYKFLGLLNIIVLLFYSLLTLKQTKNYLIKYKDEYSSDKVDLNMKWILYLVVFFTMSYLIVFLSGFFLPVFNIKEWVKTVHLISIVSFTAVFSYYTVRYALLTLHKDNIIKRKTNVEKYSRSALTDVDMNRISQKVILYFENEKPYLSEDFTLDDLSDKLGIIKNYITQAININLKENFYSLVNRYRIDEVKIVLSDSSNNNSLLETALMSGFNSKSVFNKKFKEITGITPSEWKKKYAQISKDDKNL